MSNPWDESPLWRSRSWEVERTWQSQDGGLVKLADGRLLGFGDPGQIAQLVTSYQPDFVRLQAPKGVLAHLDKRHFRFEANWLWMWTQSAPAAAGTVAGGATFKRHDANITELDEQDRRIGEIVAAAYPQRWAGADDSGATFFGYVCNRDLVGVIAVHAEHVPASTYLSGLAVLDHARRQGIGGALIAATTRWSLQRARMATLGIMADNNNARQLYERLGYQIGMNVENVVRTTS